MSDEDKQPLFRDTKTGDWFTYKGDVCVRTEMHEVHKSRVVPMIANLDDGELIEEPNDSWPITPIKVEIGELEFAGEAKKAVDIKPGYAVKLREEVLLVFAPRKAVSLKGRMMELSGGPMRYYDAQMRSGGSRPVDDDDGED